ncbi:hypothetical protein JCM13210_18410 [Thermaerobacter litoralis]
MALPQHRLPRGGVEGPRQDGARGDGVHGDAKHGVPPPWVATGGSQAAKIVERAVSNPFGRGRPRHARKVMDP